MRDRNQLSQDQFNIQLEKAVKKSIFFKKILRQEEYFSHKSCLWRSDPKNKFNNSETKIWKPNNYKFFRALVISLWYFPENIHFCYRIELEQDSLSKFNSKQKIELKILLSSKENCERYLFLTQIYTGNEIFGNILGNDLKELEKRIKIRLQIQSPAVEKVFRRGPKDKGSRRSDSSARFLKEELIDCTLREQEMILTRKLAITTKTTHRIVKFLENLS